MGNDLTDYVLQKLPSCVHTVGPGLTGKPLIIQCASVWPAIFWPGLHWTRQNAPDASGNHRSDFREPVCGLLRVADNMGVGIVAIASKNPPHRWLASLLSAQSLGPPWLRAELEDS
jgi:hypothetical protein